MGSHRRRLVSSSFGSLVCSHCLLTPLPQPRFKIATVGAFNNTHWYLEGFNRKDWNFTIPATTPPGKYLLRHEQIWPRDGPFPGLIVRVPVSLSFPFSLNTLLRYSKGILLLTIIGHGTSVLRQLRPDQHY